MDHSARVPMASALNRPLPSWPCKNLPVSVEPPGFFHEPPRRRKNSGALALGMPLPSSRMMTSDKVSISLCSNETETRPASASRAFQMSSAKACTGFARVIFSKKSDWTSTGYCCCAMSDLPFLVVFWHSVTRSALLISPHKAYSARMGAQLREKAVGRPANALPIATGGSQHRRRTAGWLLRVAGHHLEQRPFAPAPVAMLNGSLCCRSRASEYARRRPPAAAAALRIFDKAPQGQPLAAAATARSIEL